MRSTLGYIKVFVTFSVIGSVLAGAMPAKGQDLVAVSDITGGASVFVFRSGAKSAPRRYATRAKVVRTKTQRLASARAVNRQYVTLAKVAPRRVRSTVVDPNNVPVAVNTMPKDEASVIFAGVGEYYMNNEDFDKAIQFFRESVNLDAKNRNGQFGLSEALALKGNALLVKDDAAGARPLFEEALKYNPKNSPAYFGLAEVFSDLDKETEAIANYEKALANDRELTEIYVPLGILYYQQGQIAKADELLTKAIGAGSADPQTQYFLGLVRYSQNRNEEALRAFQQARTVQPNYEEAYYYSGETLARLRRFPEAITEYERATSLKPTYFDAFVGLGDAYYEVGRYADAVNAYKQAVKLKNDNPDVFENLADAYRQVGSFNEAEANYNLAALFLQRRPDYDKETLADIYNKTGFVIAKQCEINTRRAIPCRWTIAIDVLEKAANLAKTTIDNANLGWAYYNAARIDMTMRREADAKSKLERAKSNLLKAIALNPKFVDAPTLNLGVVYIDLGEYQNAINTLAPIVDKHPEWVFSKYALGTAYYKTNDFNSAAKYFKKAVDDEPSYVQALASLGYTELQRKNGKEVKRIVDRLRKLSQNEANKLESQLIASRLPT